MSRHYKTFGETGKFQDVDYSQRTQDYDPGIIRVKGIRNFDNTSRPVQDAFFLEDPQPVRPTAQQLRQETISDFRDNDKINYQQIYQTPSQYASSLLYPPMGDNLYPTVQTTGSSQQQMQYIPQSQLPLYYQNPPIGIGYHQPYTPLLMESTSARREDLNVYIGIIVVLLLIIVYLVTKLMDKHI
jgi:hypothetical protein